MKSKSVQISALLSTLLAAAVVLGGATAASAAGAIPAIPAVPSSALQPLTGADTLLTTFLSKSKIAGGIRKNADGTLAIDPNTGDAPFDFSGSIYVPAINQADGKLLATTGPVGSVSGTVIFPKAFSDLAFGFVGYLHGGPMPAIPPVIKWTMQSITIVDAGTTYVPLEIDPDTGMPKAPADASPNVNVNPMGLDGRAFTGFGPVEVGTLLNNTTTPAGLSMSVRMGGCFAVMGISGPNAGKVGTYCLNSTFTFDLSQISTSDPMHSSIPGTGSSNCITVLQTPMQMPQ